MNGRILPALSGAILCGTMLLATPAFAACETDNLPDEMRLAFISGAQEALNEHGFNAGPVDGKMGSRTRSAIRSYQRAARLPVDGCATQGLLDHLNFSQPKVYGPGARR
ncbi:peptidoglycan-binding protein [Azospirillum humicireducens]|uniref:Peptidoglycan-binding protein n=1 Tax=Azospirillum humicireducens TaxID=1226968 RepID=A0A161ITE0_9PROT|nr:peptidoglycan-binding protein [Azospirillum humicireducens]ANC90707.1 peptidoglycan-binding protein [Azospirillum humicireducens]